MTQLPSYLDTPTGPTPTPQQIREANKGREKPTASFGDIWREATVFGSLIDYFDKPNRVDPDFRVTEELLARQTRDLPASLISELSRASSEEEFMYRVRSARERLGTQQAISNMGYSGMALQFGASLLDPAFIAAAPVASLAFGTKAVQAGMATRKAVRAASALRGLGVSAVADVPVEGLRYVIDPFTDAEDFIINTSASLVLGSGLSYAFPRLAGFEKGWKQQVELERLRINSNIAAQNTDILEEAATSALTPKQAAAVRARAEQLGVPIYEELPDTRAQRIADSLEDLGGETIVEVDGQTAQVQGPRKLRPLSEVIEDLEKVEPQGPKKSFDTDFEEVTSLPKKDLFAEAKRRGVATQTTVEVVEEAAPEAAPAPKKTWRDLFRTKKSGKPRVEGTVDDPRTVVVYMTPDDYIRYSLDSPDEPTKIRRLEEVIEGGEKIDNIPHLIMREKDGKLVVSGHEGRHRATVAKAQGVEEIPVAVRLPDNAQVRGRSVQQMIDDGDLPDVITPQRGGDDLPMPRGAETPPTAPAPSPKTQSRKRQRRQFRPLDDIRADVIEARRNEAEITGQAITAMQSALLDISPDSRGSLGLVDPSDKELAEELLKPYETESLASKIFNSVPYFKPLAVMAQRSSNEHVKKLFRALVENPAGDVVTDAETRVLLNRQLAMQRYHKSRLAIRKTQGQKALEDFDNRIAQSIRDGVKLEGQAGQAQTIVQQFFKELADYADRSGIGNFGDFANLRYIPREANARQVAEAIELHGEEAVLRLLEGALRRNEPKFSNKKIKATAKAWLKYAHDPEGYVNARVTGKNADEKVAAIRKVLKDEGLADQDIDDVLDRITPKSSDPHLGMTNNRINFDESFSIEVNGKTLKFADLIEQDLTYLMEKYAARVIGAAELAKVSRALEIKANGSIPTRDEMLTWMSQTGKVDDWVRNGFDVTYRSIMGMSQGNMNPKARHALRFLQDLAFVQSMGNVGIAQLPELANSTVSNGLRATLQSVPSLRGLIRQAQNGELSDEVLEEIASLVSPGDMLEEGFSRTYKVHDDVGITDGGTAGRAFSGLRAIAAGAPVTIPGTNIRTVINPFGIAPTDEIMRNGHVRATLQNWVNQAFDVKAGKPVRNSFWSKSKKRFEYLGFNDREINELMEALSDPKVVVVEQGLLGKKIAKLNLSRMDPQLRNKMQFALRRDVDRVIQRNKVGNLSPWMQGPTGSLALQFRKFALNATNKQLVYNLKMADGKTLATVLGTIALGALGYVVNTYISSAKYEGNERKKFLEQALGKKEFMGMEVSNLMIAGIVRSGPMGFLPPLMGTATQFFDPEEQDLFNTYRTSGYTTGLLNPDSNPVLSLVNGGFEAAKELIPAALNAGFGDSVGNKLTEPELRRILRLLPLRNTIPVNFAVRELIEAADLPERQR